MKKLTFGIDVDGTLSEYFSFLPYLNQLLKTKVTPEQLIQYDLHDIFGMEYNHFCSLFDEHSDQIYRASIPRSCAQMELQWIDKHFNIVYITARLEQYKKLTEEWMIQHGFPNREIVCTGSHDKLQAISEHEVSIMVEDRLENALHIWETLKIPVYLLDTPYNQGDLPSGVHRVNNWHEIKEDIVKEGRTK